MYMETVVPIGGLADTSREVLITDSQSSVAKGNRLISNDSDAVVVQLNKDNKLKSENNIHSQPIDPALQKIRYENEIKLSSVVPKVDSRFVDFMNSISEEKQKLSQFLKIVSQANDSALSGGNSKSNLSLSI